MTDGSFITLLQSILMMAAVLALAYWCSRLLGKGWNRCSGTGRLKVLEQIQVGQDRRIILLKAGEHCYLVGVSPAGIQLLSQMEDELGAEESGEEAGKEAADFKQLLEKTLGSWRKKDGGDE